MFGPLMDQATDGTEGGGSGGGSGSGSGSGAGNGGGAFDMNAFFSRFETILDTKLGTRKQGGEGEGEGEGKGGKGGSGSGSGSGNGTGNGEGERYKKLERDLADERKKREDSERRAEEKERHSNIRGLLSDFQFANDAAREDAFRTFATEIKRGEGDGLIGPENEAAKEYIRRRLEDDRSYLLKPKDVGGSGAQNGGARGGSRSFDLNELRPGMKADDLQAMRAEIARVAANAMRGQ